MNAFGGSPAFVNTLEISLGQRLTDTRRRAIVRRGFPVVRGAAGSNTQLEGTAVWITADSAVHPVFRGSLILSIWVTNLRFQSTAKQPTWWIAAAYRCTGFPARS